MDLVLAFNLLISTVNDLINLILILGCVVLYALGWLLGIKLASLLSY